MSPTREQYFQAKEAENSLWLDKEQYQVIRVDGRAFHTFTRKQQYAKPLSWEFMGYMDQVAQALCEEIQGARFAYVQSDEISILVTAFGLKSQAWFGGQLRKWLSISAGVASAKMTTLAETTAVFDSRVVSLADVNDVTRYFLWRQSDCMRNAIQATAQHHVGHKKIIGKDRALQLQLLEAGGLDYSSMPQGWRNGRVIVPALEVGTIRYIRKDTGAEETAEVERNVWKIYDAPFFDWDKDGFLDKNIPTK